MNGTDLLVLVVGLFVTFMALWAATAYGVLVFQSHYLETDPPELDDSTDRARASQEAPASTV
jgi:hypothetical protein